MENKLTDNKMNFSNNHNEINNNDSLNESKVALKTFKSIQDNYQHYDEILRSKYKKSQQNFGRSYHKNYYLPKNFSFDENLNENLFLKRKFNKEDDVDLLLSNAMFDEFQHIKKRPVNSFYQFDNKENKVIGQYLANIDEKNNITLFAFSMIQNNNDKENDFTLKLDMCYQGKKWINICRFDSLGNEHPNYFTKTGIFENMQDVEIITAPHMHYNSVNCEILGKDKPDYMPAYHIEKSELTKNGESFFEGSLKYFAKETGLDECININTFIENKSTKQNFFEDPIFLYDNQNDLTY